jgi:hypothetical protein
MSGSPAAGAGAAAARRRGEALQAQVGHARLAQGRLRALTPQEQGRRQQEQQEHHQQQEWRRRRRRPGRRRRRRGRSGIGGPLRSACAQRVAAVLASLAAVGSCVGAVPAPARKTLGPGARALPKSPRAGVERHPARPAAPVARSPASQPQVSGAIADSDARARHPRRARCEQARSHTVPNNAAQLNALSHDAAAVRRRQLEGLAAPRDATDARPAAGIVVSARASGELGSPRARARARAPGAPGTSPGACPDTDRIPSRWRRPGAPTI